MHRVTQQQHIRAAWPWVLGALVLAAVVTFVVWVVHPQSPTCRSASVGALPTKTRSGIVAPTNSLAGVPVPSIEHRDPPTSGQARYYVFNQNVSCSFPDLPMDGYYVGVPTDEYAGGAACGARIDIDGPLGSVRAMVVDRCPGCGPHQYDLSTAAFTRVAAEGPGVAAIHLTRVHDPVPPPDVLYRVQDGSSPAWIGLLFADTGNPLSRVEIRPDAGGPGHVLNRGMDNYWTISGAGPGPFTALLTDTEDNQLQIPGIPVTPGEIQHTNLHLYTSPPPPPTPTKPPTPTTITPAPTMPVATPCT
ncbi:expansin EXLX1 family cellulose-binding protein [Nocardia sp. NPDC051570]|uniref:expansin EXLX1 family cellulose-binding protein n=1 Tax=Nocardia sp. NPDC051570 TaxID=3364324 RepID=UPI00379DA287